MLSGPAPGPIAAVLMVALGVGIGEFVWRISERRDRKRG